MASYFMVRTYFVFLLLFTIFSFSILISISKSLQASCTLAPSSGTSTITVTLSDCNWEPTNGYNSDGNLGADKPITGDVVFNISNLKGHINEIEALQPADKKHTVNVTAKSDFSVGKMYVANGGALNVKSNSSVSFTGEGLQTGDVQLTETSNLYIKGSNSDSKIGTVDIDATSGLYVQEGAKLEIGGGKGIQGTLRIESGSELTLNYNEVSEVPETDLFFEVKTLYLDGDGSKIVKKGAGKVVVRQPFYYGNISILVQEGILDIGAIGNKEELPADNFVVKGGQLKFTQGNFKAIVEGTYKKDLEGNLVCDSTSCGELYIYTKESDNSSLEINNGNSPSGKVIAESGGVLNIKNSQIDVLNVKSGRVYLDSANGSTNHINNLIIQGGSVDTGALTDNNSTFSNIEISNEGVFNYSNSRFYENKVDEHGNLILENGKPIPDYTKPILKSLTIYDYGVFVFQGNKDLILDGTTMQIDASDNGIIKVNSVNNFTLTLRHIQKQIANLWIVASNGTNSVVIEDDVYIGKITLDTRKSDDVFNVEGSNIDQIDVKYYSGTLNITKDAQVKDIINNSDYNPKINIDGGTIDHISLAKVADVKIYGDAQINILDITGYETVDINGGSINELNVSSKNNKAKLNIVGGEIGIFRLNSLIEFTITDTKIKTYEIGVEGATIDFTQQNVEELFLNGKNSTVNVGNGDEISALKRMSLDYGTIVYHYETDYYLESLLTTFTHEPPAPPEPCKPDDTECEEKEPEPITYDSEFIIKAGNSTLTVGDIKLENLVIESGNLVVENNMEIQRKLSLGIDSSNKDTNYKVYSMGEVSLSGILEVDFNSTYDALLGVENNFALMYADNGIKKDDTEFIFSTNLADWFEVDADKYSTSNSIVVSIYREYTYYDVLSQYGQTGGLLDIAQILDSMIAGETYMTDDMKIIITGLDTNSKDASGLVTNMTQLLPTSSRAYANSMHVNTNKIVDNLSLELRDFTNLESNTWFKMQNNQASLKNNEDVVGYSEDSNMMQAGYTHIINSKLILGGSFAYVGGNLNGVNANYRQDFTTFNLSVGADYLIDSSVYVKSILSYSATNFDNTRNLQFIESKVRSDLGADEIMAHVELGYVTILPEKYHDFNANYNVFYSISSINIDGYSEQGVGKLNVDATNAFVNDLGVGAIFDKELIYDREDVSLKPSISFATGVRLYSNVDTNFKFQDVDSDTLVTTNGSYLPVFFKTRVAVDYITHWSNISVGYKYETDVTRYNDSSFYISFKHSF